MNTQHATKLKFTFDLDNRIAIYVPSTTDINKAVDNSEQVNNTIKKLSIMFGGATATRAAGGWVCNDGSLVIETVTIVYSFCTSEQLYNNFAAVVGICEDIKKEMKQEAVTLEINGQVKFI